MSFRTLDLNLLRVFDVVMIERQVTRAADRLAMTQPAVSNALRRLREALGDDLFVSGPAGVTPTRRAEALWPAVRQAMQSLRDTIEPEHFDPRHAIGRGFTLLMADATAAVWLPEVARLWARHGAACDLRVAGLTSRDPRPALDPGMADVAIGFFPDVARAVAAEGDGGSTRMEPLYRCRYVAVMRHDHPLAEPGEPLTLDRYCAASHARVDFAGRPHGFVDEALHRLGRSRRIVLTLESFATALEVVAGSDLVTVLPLTFLQSSPRAGHLVFKDLPLDLPPIEVDMLWHRRFDHDAGQRWLRELLREAAQAVT
jgi:DNA-binding transcriptional LysR family regulator